MKLRGFKLEAYDWGSCEVTLLPAWEAKSNVTEIKYNSVPKCVAMKLVNHKKQLERSDFEGWLQDCKSKKSGMTEVKCSANSFWETED